MAQFFALAAAIGLPFLGAALAPLLYRLLGDRVGLAGAAIAATSSVLLLTQLGADGTVSVPWIPSMGVAVRLTVDGLSLLFALLASGIGILIFAYASEYMHGKPDLGRFYSALLAFMGSIVGLALAADLVLLFVFWELTSVCSFVLIGYYTADEESRYSARMAMLITVGGGLCLLVAILLLGIGADAVGLARFDLSAILANREAVAEALRARGLFIPTLALVVVAAGAKSAQVPLYFWLPGAMVAPTPVSAFLHSATMVKVGVYALGRLRPLFHSPEWTAVVATLGLVTMTVGAMLAVISTDIKELLAYSTASHLGLLVAAFGFESHYGAEAGAFHLFNHALFKAALFLVAGIIAHEAGTRLVDDLGGLRTDLPITAAITFFAALSMAGIPPFSGFYSKEIMFEAAWDAAQAGGGIAWLYPATAVFASIFTVLYSLRFLWLFFGDRPEELDAVHRPPVGLLASPVVLAVGVLAVSLFPGVAIDLILDDAAAVTAVHGVEIHAGLPTYISGPVVMSAITITLGVAGFPFYDRIQSAINRGRSATTALHPTTVYGALLMAADRGSAVAGNGVHNGLIRTYAWWVLSAACVLTLGGYATTAAGLPAPAIAETPAALVLVLAVAVVAAVAVTTAGSHVTGVLTLGILGFMVAIFYILASGADLALTQLVVETLLLLIFLLVIEELPAYYGEIDWPRASRDAVLSVAVGATAFVSVLYAARDAGGAPTETATYFTDNAIPEGGGANIVNVILTDFRAFDTLGESIVIVLAALSVLVLLTMRDRGETR